MMLVELCLFCVGGVLESPANIHVLDTNLALSISQRCFKFQSVCFGLRISSTVELFQSILFVAVTV